MANKYARRRTVPSLFSLAVLERGMYILGISAFYHDSAAVLVQDGTVICAAEEERFSRTKHDNRFPEAAIRFCLAQAAISAADLDCVAYYEKPLLKFERVLDTFVATYPRSFASFIVGIPEWLCVKIQVEKLIRKNIGFRGKIFFIPHHVSHAASVFYPSPFEEAAMVTVDGVGEYQTTGIWYGKASKISPLKKLDFPHSLGLFYSTITAYLGFRVNDDEYKVMGLAAYGTPSFKKELYQTVSVKDDGGFELNLKYFSFPYRSQMWNRSFESLLGAPRMLDDPIDTRHADIAATAQYILEDIYFKILNHAHQLTGSSNVCISGGVALNAIANGKLYTRTPFRRAYILGPAGDSGGAIGAALYAYHNLCGGTSRTPLWNLDLGSSYSDAEIESALTEQGVPYRTMTDEGALIQAAARLLQRGRVIGWFQGRMEFGPRALGARSILARPYPASMKDRVNKIKIREQFRPFAGSILEEFVHEYFVLPEAERCFPFMNFCFSAKPKRRDEISAIVHADGSTRIQTVGKDGNRFRRLIEKYHELTGSPCILNTSFNLGGEPIVETPRQAVVDFLKTEMDALVIGNCIAEKSSTRDEV